jgi:uncharacterized protein YgiM (DUF1202 family)
MLKRILSLTLAAVLALAAFATVAFAEEVKEENIYYVYTENGKELNVRNAPNGEIIGKLPYGEEVKVSAFINDNWAVINFQNDKAGYVNTRYLIPVHPDVVVKAIEEEKESFTGDPMVDIDNEFASAVDVDDYDVTARPARVTSVVYMRWIPSETGRIIAKYKATEKLVVLKEMDHYLQVKDPDTGDVGYIHKKFAAK